MRRVPAPRTSSTDTCTPCPDGQGFPLGSPGFPVPCAQRAAWEGRRVLTADGEIGPGCLSQMLGGGATAALQNALTPPAHLTPLRLGCSLRPTMYSRPSLPQVSAFHAGDAPVPGAARRQHGPRSCANICFAQPRPGRPLRRLPSPAQRLRGAAPAPDTPLGCPTPCHPGMGPRRLYCPRLIQWWRLGAVGISR